MIIRRGVLILAAALLLPSYTCDYTSEDDPPGGSPSGSFKLLLPLDGSTANLTMPQFNWTADQGAGSYRLQIATTPAFSPPIWDQPGIPLPTVFLGATLTNSSTFYWRVYSDKGGVQTLAGGSPFQLTTVGTGGAVPQNFAMIVPPSMSAGASHTPRFEWGASVAATEYILEVATDFLFTSMVVSQPGIKINQIDCPVTLSPSTTYYWQVTAKNSVIPKLATGAPWSFTTAP